MWLLKSAEAKQRFDELIEAAAQGEEVLIELESGRRVKLASEPAKGPQREPGTDKGLFVMSLDYDEQDLKLMTPRRKKRTPGSAAGLVWMADDFDDP